MKKYKKEVKNKFVPPMAFKKGNQTGTLALKKWRENGGITWSKGMYKELNPRWKGDKAGFSAMHQWLKRRVGKASFCTFDKTHESKGGFEWANISHEYKREVSDYMSLCRRCHMKYDMTPEKKERMQERAYKNLFIINVGKGLPLVQTILSL